MARQLTDEQFKKRIYKAVGDEYTSLSKYGGAHIKVKMKHEKCGHIWEITANSFTNGGRRCPHCSRKESDLKTRKTHEQFEIEFEKISKGEYELLSKYIKQSKKIKVLHKECEHIYLVTPKNFLNNRRCPNCFKNKKKTTEEYKKEVKKITEGEYTVLGDYVNNRITILTRHNTCEHEWELKPSNFYHGRRCPKCRDSRPPKTTEQFKKEVFNLEGENFRVISEYTLGREDIKMIHKKCGKDFFVTPDTFLSRRSCPNCNMTRGELKVAQWLINNKINFKPEKTFDNFKSEKGWAYRFDFAVYDENELILLIEYDGVQHFEPVDFANKGEEWAVKNYLKTIHRDEIKNNYCKEKGIELLRIPYTKFNEIETILQRSVLNSREVVSP